MTRLRISLQQPRFLLLHLIDSIRNQDVNPGDGVTDEESGAGFLK